MVQILGLLETILPGLEVVSIGRGDRVAPDRVREIRGDARQSETGSASGRPTGLGRWSEAHRGTVVRLHGFAAAWVESIRELGALKLAVMDDPIYFGPLFRQLKKLGIPVVAVCHNLESLSPGQVGTRWALGLLREELAFLSQCRLVVTISREETVLLNNLGVSTLYLPYQPAAPIRNRLLAVRENRRESRKAGILMVGTTKNLPTLQGLAAVAAHWRRNRLERVVGPLIVGGYGSEKFFDPQPYGDSLDFRGTLLNDSLDALLSRVNAVLCYQESGSGALTRIGEMLVAGVPVLANSQAARSYYGAPGLIEFGDLAEMDRLLLRTPFSAVDVPLPPDADGTALALAIETIRQER